ncbi:MAG TPA: CRTAC1 family protein [Vicinamibacteria bacterium]|nr:CRTAC1 family protein [Vicinamibacteria bacterium]
MRTVALGSAALLLAGRAALAQAPIAPTPAAPAPGKLPVFVDVTARSGITWQRSFGDHELSNIVEGTGSGACVFDFDGDGKLDIYFPQGRWEKTVSDNRGRDLIDRLGNALYRNKGNFEFEDVTAKAGVAGRSFAFGCSAADYDNDGHVDLIVLTYRGPELYHNNGDGTFTEVTEKAGLVDPRWALNAAWLDYDRDGYLDLFVSNYLEYDEGKFRSYYAAAGYPGPLSYNGVSCALYHNNGDGTFTDVTKKAGVSNPGGRAMSSVAADLNNDGWMDVYVANDSMENYYYENKGDGTFAERAFELGLALGQNGQGVSSMGPAVADLEGGEYLDILKPDMDYGTLLSKQGQFYEDLIDRSGLALICGQYAGWGAVVQDFDNDGYTDVFIANGNPHHEYPEDAVLARNNGKGVFVDVARESGEFFQKKWSSRGATWADFDDDGNVDLVVLDTSGPPHVLRNQGGTGNNWLKVDAVVKGGKRTAIGARVTIEAGGRRQFQDVIGVNGYLSQGDTRVHFGLGRADKVDLVKVRWPDGSTEEWRDVKPNQVLRLEQGKR